MRARPRTSRVDERTVASCPPALAAGRTRGFFRAHGNREGDLAKLRLGIRVAIRRLPAVTLGRDVIVTIRWEPSARGSASRATVQWAAEHRGPFPLFSGELTLAAAGDGARTELRLRGGYEIPAGGPGRAIDALLGGWVARATALALVQRIADAVAAAPAVPDGRVAGIAPA